MGNLDFNLSNNPYPDLDFIRHLIRGAYGERLFELWFQQNVSELALKPEGLLLRILTIYKPPGWKKGRKEEKQKVDYLTVDLKSNELISMIDVKTKTYFWYWVNEHDIKAYNEWKRENKKPLFLVFVFIKVDKKWEERKAKELLELLKKTEIPKTIKNALRFKELSDNAIDEMIKQKHVTLRKMMWCEIDDLNQAIKERKFEKIRDNKSVPPFWVYRFDKYWQEIFKEIGLLPKYLKGVEL
jgi:hypothetical protein